MFAELPVGIADPAAAARRRSGSQMAGLKESKQAVAGEDAHVAVRLRAADAAGARGPASPASLPQRSLNTGTTNVPGPQFPLYLAGRRMLESFPYIPLFASVRVAVAIFSYDGALSFGVSGDYDTAPDIDVLAPGSSTASPSWSRSRSPHRPMRALRAGRRALRAPGTRSASAGCRPGGRRRLTAQLAGQAPEQCRDLGVALGAVVGERLGEEVAAGVDDPVGLDASLRGQVRIAVLAGDQAALAQLLHDRGDAGRIDPVLIGQRARSGRSVLVDPDQRPDRPRADLDAGALGDPLRGSRVRSSRVVTRVSARSVSASESEERGAARLSSRPGARGRGLAAAVRSSSSRLSTKPSAATAAAIRNTGRSECT